DETWDDQDYEYFFGEYLDDGYRPKQPQEVKELPPIENTLTSKGSLADHLMWQLNLQTDDELVRQVGGAIIGNIDSDGYLVASVNEIAALGAWDITDVERSLEHIQTFDPVGVGARDLQECLLLQLKSLGLANTPAETLVKDHLRLLQNHRIPELAKALGLEPEEIKQHIELIKNLDPKPGSRYSPADSQYVIPDVYIIKTDEGYRAVLNEDGLPQLRISPVYRRLLDKGGETSDETRAYVKDKFRAALWLLKSVDQRQKTIVKVATSIINFQRAFLDQGIEHLRPLVLRDVASDIGMHESTVSRVVNNKYMHTPQGVYELKYFFHSGISSSYGESVSSVTIKQRIRKIIEAEDQRRPLSDSKIMNILQKEGLVLARRTIAKYREELKIATSNQRKVLY
ncbi:MAG: RNA polymerase factor sigma-54, partial [Acidobacteriota bacterium]